MARSTGLRTEILLTLSLLIGAALLLGGVLMLRLTEQNLLEQKIAQLRLHTETLARSLAANNAYHAEQTSGLSVLNQLSEQLHYTGWWFYDQDLLLLAAYRDDSDAPVSAVHRQQVRLSGQPLEFLRFPSLLESFTAEDAGVRFLQPIMRQGALRGVLEIHYSLDDIRHRLLFSQRMVLLYVFLYGSVLVLVGYYLLQRNVIKPARNLLQATEDVSRGHLETRLPVAGPKEIAHLAGAYNRMVTALQESRQETRNHISALEKTNDELKQARDELIRSEKLASVGQLAAGLAHELGNPLAALTGYLSYLQEQLQDEQAEVVRRATTEAERIDYLVREMLDFSRPTEVSQDVLEPGAVLRSAVSLLEHQGAFSGVACHDELPEKLAKVKISGQKLQQVFINLLLNAIFACRDGGDVTLTAGEAGDSCWLQIIDSGCGITPEALKRIFDPFYTSKAPGKGTGLGLSICQRIVDEVGGRLEVESQQGTGSRFKVVLPKECISR